MFHDRKNSNDIGEPLEQNVTQFMGGTVFDVFRLNFIAAAPWNTEERVS